MRWVVISLFIGSIFLWLAQIDKTWAIVLFVVAFVIGASEIDKKQKERLNKRIDELEKRIDKIKSS